MSAKLELAKLILDKSAEHVSMLRIYLDDTKYILQDHDKAMTLLEMAKDIVEEALLP